MSISLILSPGTEDQDIYDQQASEIFSYYAAVNVDDSMELEPYDKIRLEEEWLVDNIIVKYVEITQHIFEDSIGVESVNSEAYGHDNDSSFDGNIVSLVSSS